LFAFISHAVQSGIFDRSAPKPPLIRCLTGGDGPALFDIYKRGCLYYTNPVQAKQINREEVPMETGENAVSYFEQGNN
jgi:hypothetical protein